MLVWIVGFAVDPCAPDHAQPSASEDANGVRMIAATSAGLSIDMGGPLVGVALLFFLGGRAVFLRLSPHFEDFV